MALFLLCLIYTTPAVADNTNPFTSGQSHYDQNEFSLALADWQKAASQGYTPAMDKLADMYANGTGVPVDYKKALEYWHQAADKGDSDAMYEIGLSYELARGVPKDSATRDTWLNKALEKCNIHAAGRFLGSSEKTDEAVACLRKNAQAGDYKAMLDLAGKNWDGNAVLKNPLEAISWGKMAQDAMQKNADAGDTQAMYYLGRTLFGGAGDAIHADTYHGLQWFEKAAALGDIDSINRLVAIYATDDTYKNDDRVRSWNKKAIEYYTIKAQKGDVNAMLRLAGKYNSPPNGEGKDVNKAADWAQKAAALGSRDALTLLGYIYEDEGKNNDNPLHDCKKAHDFYDKAAILDEPKAHARLEARAKGAQGPGCDF